MLTPRALCRPLKAVAGLREISTHSNIANQTGFWASRACTRININPSSRVYRSPLSACARLASLTTRSPPGPFVLDWRQRTSNPTPAFRRRWRRTADGSLTRTPKPRSEATVEELDRELAWTMENYPSITRIEEMLSILIFERQCHPNPWHYEALILGNCDPEHGSVANVQNVLEEMKEAQIAIGATIYNAVLKVWSVQPFRIRQLMFDRFSVSTRTALSLSRLWTTWHINGSVSTLKHDTTSSPASFEKASLKEQRRK